jgi:hypothetical protein
MNAHDKPARKGSAAALEHIDRLRRNGDFEWFMSQVQTRLENRRKDALYLQDEAAALRQRAAFRALEEDAVNLLDTLEAGHRRVLGDSGVTPEDAQ